jgi:ABC-type multidrug transport system ATPase subunit
MAEKRKQSVVVLTTHSMEEAEADLICFENRASPMYFAIFIHSMIL